MAVCAGAGDTDVPGRLQTLPPRETLTVGKAGGGALEISLVSAHFVTTKTALENYAYLRNTRNLSQHDPGFSPLSPWALAFSSCSHTAGRKCAPPHDPHHRPWGRLHHSARVGAEGRRAELPSTPGPGPVGQTQQEGSPPFHPEEKADGRQAAGLGPLWVCLGQEGARSPGWLLPSPLHCGPQLRERMGPKVTSSPTVASRPPAALPYLTRVSLPSVLTLPSASPLPLLGERGN